MVKSLILVWLVGVVAFFVLWALLAALVRRISEKRNGDLKGDRSQPSVEEKQSAPESDAPEG